jgi:hypothetical protein
MKMAFFLCGTSAAKTIVLDNGCRKYYKNLNEDSGKYKREGHDYFFLLPENVKLSLSHEI